MLHNEMFYIVTSDLLELVEDQYSFDVFENEVEDDNEYRVKIYFWKYESILFSLVDLYLLVATTGGTISRREYLIINIHRADTYTIKDN